MTDRTSTRVEQLHPMGGKLVMLKSGTTLCGTTDTLTLTLADFGIKKVLAVKTFVHTTDYSVIVTEAATTAVATGILTVQPLTTAGHEDKRRIVMVHGE